MQTRTMILTIFTGGLMSMAAVAQERSPADPAAPVADPAVASSVATSEGKLQIGVSFLPMVLGRERSPDLRSGVTATRDLTFAYGFAPVIGYAVLPGLTVGIAPQFILNVKDKDSATSASKEYDFMARIAYAYAVVPKVSVYAEFLPGYSIISLSSSYSGISNPKGVVLAGGVGAAMDVTDLIFVNFGIGYQYGTQTTTYFGMDFDVKTSFLRIAIGGGVKL